jgi:hypothetical protein
MIELKDFYKEDKTIPDRVFYFEPEAIKVIELDECEEDDKTIYYLQINNEYIFGYETKEERDKELLKIFNEKGNLNKDNVVKEKKIIKKKLDEMTQKEIDKVSARLCFGNTCQECPFVDNNDLKCLDDFLDWKKRYLDNKDKEFEIEVEE